MSSLFTCDEHLTESPRGSAAVNAVVHEGVILACSDPGGGQREEG